MGDREDTPVVELCRGNPSGLSEGFRFWVAAASRQAWAKSRTWGLRSLRRQAIASRAGSRPLTGMQTIPSRE